MPTAAPATNGRISLEAQLTQIDKEFGTGTVIRLGDQAVRRDIEAIPTGALSLDIALGIGGVPRGRIVELYGPESSGKTTLAHHIIAEAQRLGGTCAFIDAEHAMDTDYAARRGSASTSTGCCSASRITASRPSRWPTCWCAPTSWPWW